MWRATVIWLDKAYTQSEAHVYPLVDLHDHAESSSCWCHPEAQPTETGLLWTHRPEMPSHTRRGGLARAG